MKSLRKKASVRKVFIAAVLSAGAIICDVEAGWIQTHNDINLGTGEIGNIFEHRNGRGQEDVYGSFVVLPDVHIAWDSTAADGKCVQRIVDWINDNKDSDDYKIKFVLFLGDISDQGKSGDGSSYVPYTDFISIANKLEVPYIPVMGNHDVFYPWEDDIDSRACEEAFYNSFDSVYTRQKYDLNDELDKWRWGMYHVKHKSQDYYFTNGSFEVSFGAHGRWHFAFLDFCSRHKRSYADVFNWTEGSKDGTLNWLKNDIWHVKNRGLGTDRTILFSHFPPQRPHVSYTERSKIEDALGHYRDYVGLWLAGHEHKDNHWVGLEDQFPVFGWLPWPFNKILFSWVTKKICGIWVLDNLAGQSPSGQFHVFRFHYDATPSSGPGNGGGGGGGAYDPCAFGCPDLYVWNGSEFEKDNSILPASRVEWVMEDYYKLQVPMEPKDGYLTLRIHDDEGTITYLDAIRLVMVDHPDSTTVETTTNGRIVHHACAVEAISCVNQAGQNLLSLIEEDDSLFVELGVGDWINVNFGDVPRDSGWIGFPAEPKESLFCLPYQGTGSGVLGIVFPREKSYMAFMDLSPIENDTGDLNIKFSLLSGLPASDSGRSKINTVSYFPQAPDEDLRVIPTVLVEATHHDSSGLLRTITYELSDIDGDVAKLSGSEWFELKFALYDTTSLKDGYTREIMVVSTGQYVLPAPQNSWRVRLAANSDSRGDTSNWAGVEYAAKDSFDHFDYPEPPASCSPYLQLYFPHPEWEHSLGDKFREDIKRAADLSDSTMVFDLEIDTDQEDKDITVTISPVDVDTGYGIYLLDLESNFTQDIRIDSTYTYNSGTSGIHKFQLIVGQYARTISPGWALISVPFVPDEPNPDSIFKDCGANYWMYEFAHLSGYQIPDSILNGEAYWLGVDSAVSLNTSGTTPPGSVSVTLTQGWNLVGDPFSEPVGLYDLRIVKGSDTFNMTSAVDSEWVVPVLYGFSPETNSYTVSDFLDPWCGYWFTAIEDSLKLLSFRTTVGAKSGAPSIALQQQTIDNWSLHITANSEGLSDNLTTLGTLLEATDGFDARHDWFEPPVAPNKKGIEAYFSREEWKPEIGTRFSRDIRSSIQDGKTKTWEVDINYEEAAGKAGNRIVTARRALTERKKEVVLSWPSIGGVPEGLSFTLVDKQSGKKTDMRLAKSYTYQHIRGRTCQFEIEVTCQEGARGPAHIWKLHQNRPNPFLKNTLISYSVAARSHVSLKLYDVSGRMVKTLVDAHMKPGSYSIKWDSKNVSSGVYFMKFKTEKFKDTKKMVIL